VNPIDSPAKLSLVINEAVPNAARILALFTLGRLYRQEDDLPTALRAFEKALTLKPEEPTTLASLHFYIGILLPQVRGLQVATLTDAIDHFTQALALKPDWPRISCITVAPTILAAACCRWMKPPTSTLRSWT